MLNQNDIRKIAKLARLRLNERELETYTGELNGILGWVEQLQAVNTDNVPPMAGVGQYTLRMREDRVTDGGIRDAVLANAPESEFDCFVVPKVIE